jgi:hypothetical protein
VTRLTPLYDAHRSDALDVLRARWEIDAGPGSEIIAMFPESGAFVLDGASWPERSDQLIFWEGEHHERYALSKKLRLANMTADLI